MKKTSPKRSDARLAAFAFFALAAAAALAAPGRKSQNHVPEALNDEIRPFYAVAATRPHIALVNVAGAIPEDVWRHSATYAASRLQVNLWTNAIPASVTARLIENPAYVAKAVGNANAKVGVFFERRGGKGCRTLSAPGAWAVVDVSFVEEGSPDAQTLRDRYAKLVLKGLAEAVGGGATLEPFCSMFYGSQTVEGMDKTNITLAPMCYFPMLEILIIVLALALALAATIAYTASVGRRVPAPPLATASPPTHSPIPAEPRHQVADLPSDWISRLGDFFNPTDGYLALFAQLGRIDGMDIVPSPDAFMESSFSEPLAPVAETDPAWVVEMKSILVGMKEEALTLAKGGKAPQEIILWLRERQRMEAGYRAQILAGDGTDDEKAARLEAVGLQPLAPTVAPR